MYFNAIKHACPMWLILNFILYIYDWPLGPQAMSLVLLLLGHVWFNYRITVEIREVFRPAHKFSFFEITVSQNPQKFAWPNANISRNADFRAVIIGEACNQMCPHWKEQLRAEDGDVQMWVPKRNNRVEARFCGFNEWNSSIFTDNRVQYLV